MPRSPRFESLDALRGFAILGMAWSGLLPDTLPAWMYHAQWPPPDHIVSEKIYGITWVDLVFPFFIFSMGASIPLALTARLSKGQPLQKTVWGILVRGALLYAFAIYGQHLRPGAWANAPGPQDYKVAILGFFLLVLMFLRWPQRLPKWFGRSVTLLAWVTSSLIIAYHLFPDGNRGFGNYRNDIILLVLANLAVSGGLIWLCTRCRPVVRLGLMAVVALVVLNASTAGSLAKEIWDYTPLQYFDLDHWKYGRFVPIFYHFEFQKYLLILLPGTFCGDLILRMAKERREEETNTAEDVTLPGLEDTSVREPFPWQAPFLFALGLAAPIIACIGLFARAVLQTSLILLAISIGMLLLTLASSTPMQRMLQGFVRWGSALLFLGLLAEPIGGGIRKDSPTMSYYLVTSGLAFLLLCSLASVIDQLKLKIPFKLVTLTGANPILGYITITNLVMGVGGLIGWSAWVATTSAANSPWATALLDGGVKTLAVALVTAACTRLSLFLRT